MPTCSESEIKLIPLLCDKLGVSVDVGAYEGGYTEVLSRHSLFVHAFEPVPKLFEKLIRRRFVRQGNIQVHNFALSSCSGKKVLSTPLLKSRFGGSYALYAMSSLEESAHRHLKRCCSQYLKDKRCVVAVRKLDEFELTGVAFIKIDVEGHEFSVLSGAQNTLEKSRPNLLIEIDYRYNHGGHEKINRWLNKIGYCGWFINEKTLLPFGRFDVHTMQYQPLNKIKHRPMPHVPGLINNFIFIPIEKIAEVKRNIARTLIKHQQAGAFFWKKSFLFQCSQEFENRSM